jgi:hypothetical protein
VVRDFEVYVYDRRYKVPTLQFPSAKNAAGAIAWALSYLESSDWHIAAEVWEGDRFLASLGAPVGRRAPLSKPAEMMEIGATKLPPANQ